MLCRNCGEAIDDTAKFCPSCGLQQFVERSSSQPGSAGASAHSPTSERALEASDVTVILPRSRANALVAAAAQRHDAPPSESTASKQTSDKPPTQRSSVPTRKIVGAAIILVMAAVAVAFFANRVATPARNAGDTSATAVEATSAPTPRPVRSDEPDRALANPDAASTPAIEAGAAAAEPPIAETPPPQGSPQRPSTKPVMSPANATQRKKGRAPTTPLPGPAPVEDPSPQPVAIAPPAPASVTASPAVEPVKVERVPCADSSNLFSRELCLWQECPKAEYRSHAECARFTGPGATR